MHLCITPSIYCTCIYGYMYRVHQWTQVPIIHNGACQWNVSPLSDWNTHHSLHTACLTCLNSLIHWTCLHSLTSSVRCVTYMQEHDPQWCHTQVWWGITLPETFSTGCRSRPCVPSPFLWFHCIPWDKTPSLHVIVTTYNQELFLCSKLLQ